MNIYRVFVPFALGYFLSYLLRVVNAVIAPDLIAELNLTAADLGLMTSANFLAFTIVQLPVGILLDRYGPRRTDAALLLFAGLGCFIFANAATAGGLIAGRALIGLGTAACLMGAFKAFAMWLPSGRLPFANGLQMAAGGLGAVAGTVPVEMALTVTDWRGIFVVLSIMSLAMSALVFFVLPRRKGAETQPGTLKEQLAGFSQVFTAPVFWRIVPMTVASQAMFLSTQSLWSGPWLSDVAGLSRDAVANHLFWIAASMVAGFLGMGTIAERLGRIGIKTKYVAFTGMAIFAALQTVLIVQWTGAVLPIWMLFGFFGTAGILPYAALGQEFPPELAGRVVTGLNVFTFGSAFLGQWGIGVIINQWPTSASGGYAVEGYQAAFIVMAVLQVLTLIWFLVYRKT